MNEAYTFEGLCNRINCIASSILRWEKEFLLRWPVNSHCPVPLEDLFDIPSLRHTSDQGEWSNYAYQNSSSRLCHYFLTTDRSRSEVLQVYRQILDWCTVSKQDVPKRSIGLHFRKHIGWERASDRTCIDLAIRLSLRTGVSDILVASDHDPSALSICNLLSINGLNPILLGRNSGGKSDQDRSKERVIQFASVWKTLSECPWTMTNAISSTVLDASRALGNEVWTFGDIGARSGPGCELFNPPIQI